MTYAFMADEPPPPRRRSRISWPVVIVVGVLAVIVAVTFLRPSTVSERQREDKTVRVVLPPPPPPPPPPEIKPQEKPPEPKPTPIEQPVDTTPPPQDAPAQPTVGDSALTAREGAGPSYGQTVGDGSGSRIGGRPGGGGDAFAAYANAVATPCVRQAVQADRELRRGSYTARLSVAVDAAGRISSVRSSTGDARRDQRLRQILHGHQCAGRTPPAGLPTMNIELNARAAG
jgi:type IV secretory pathway VirB10-like protein